MFKEGGIFMVRIPQITSLETAIKLYYENIEIGNQEIKMLFGSISSATVCKLKNLAKEKMLENNVPSWNALNVNTKTAYKAWGLDIDDLEFRYNKLKELNLMF